MRRQKRSVKTASGSIASMVRYVIPSKRFSQLLWDESSLDVREYWIALINFDVSSNITPSLLIVVSYHSNSHYPLINILVLVTYIQISAKSGQSRSHFLDEGESNIDV